MSFTGPELVDEALARDHLPSPPEEKGEERALLEAAQREEKVAGANLQAAK